MAADSTASPAPSATSTGYACLEQEGGYEAQGVCQVTATVQAICKLDAPYLQYSLDAQGTPDTTATIVWGDPNGKNVTMANMPLSGTVLWPGATVDANGNATDWPGWTQLPDGSWQRGDDWDWVRPTVPVTFHVNPTAVVTAQYPANAMPCADPPTTEVLADEDHSAVLAMTGSDVLHLGIGAAVLIALGGLLLVVRSRSRKRAAER